ncbi:hypothetical protein M0R04_14935 [Candidatus Dojkabacteria bacterium]|jgi:hypothetical protein|nr:hypothetical protein [Candidatus Dojkabacteria bacterium]
MILAQVCMAALIIYLGYNLFNAFSLFNVLSQNFELANNPKVEERIKGGFFDRTYQQAGETYDEMKSIHMPGIAGAIVGVSVVWGAYLFGYTTSPVVLFLLSIFTATVLIRALTYDYFPTWLLNWYDLLSITHLQLHLEFIQEELKLAQVTLKAVVAGTLELTEEEESQLKQYTIEMAAEALQVSQAMVDIKKASAEPQ